MILITGKSKTLRQQLESQNQSKIGPKKRQIKKTVTDKIKSINAPLAIIKSNSYPSRQSIKAQRDKINSRKQVSKDTSHQLKEETTHPAGCQSKQALTGIPV
ncbi:hypothetical protein [Parasynechococcus sp.]|uniref:hypothetical protein n=1 Tax=Parasynechococcus sp. TaxID=3101203 RepID=UPI003703EF39